MKKKQTKQLLLQSVTGTEIMSANEHNQQHLNCLQVFVHMTASEGVCAFRILFCFCTNSYSGTV